MKMLSQVITKASGSVGGVTYTRNRYAAIVQRSKVKPVNPNTTRQANVRASFTAVSQRWNSLSFDQQAAWRDWAAANPIQDFALGGTVALDGHAAFIRVNLVRRNKGLVTTIDDPPLAPQGTWADLSSLLRVVPGVDTDGATPYPGMPFVFITAEGGSTYTTTRPIEARVGIIKPSQLFIADKALRSLGGLIPVGTAMNPYTPIVPVVPPATGTNTIDIDAGGEPPYSLQGAFIARFGGALPFGGFTVVTQLREWEIGDGGPTDYTGIYGPWYDFRIVNNYNAETSGV